MNIVKQNYKMFEELYDHFSEEDQENIDNDKCQE